MYSIRTTAQFRRDVKRCQRQGKDMSLFKLLNETLIAGKTLPEKHRDHALMGNWKGHRDCHITPDWLLIYRIDADEQEIEYVRMGSHTELFNQ